MTLFLCQCFSFPTYWHTKINDFTENLKLYINVHDSKFTQDTAVTIIIY